MPETDDLIETLPQAPALDTPGFEARFRLQHPRDNWEGVVNGVKFIRGVGWTDDPGTAHGLMSQGVLPIDRNTGRPAFGLDGDDEAMLRLANHAAAAWPVKPAAK